MEAWEMNFTVKGKKYSIKGIGSQEKLILTLDKSQRSLHIVWRALSQPEIQELLNVDEDDCF
jgi:hypothetical protein